MVISEYTHDLLCKCGLFAIGLFFAVCILDLIIEKLAKHIRFYKPYIKAHIKIRKKYARIRRELRREEKAIKFINEHPYHSYKIRTR